MNKLVVGLGEILWDVLPEGKRLGGAPANFAYHVAQFGLESCVVSAVGTDAAGDEILQSLEAKRLDYRMNRVAYPTGTVDVELDKDGIPLYHIREQVAWDYLVFTPDMEELARQAQAVCFGSLAQRSPVSRSTIRRFLETMPDGAGRYKIFDMNLRQHYYTKEVIQDSLRRCNVLKLNEEELDTIRKWLDFQKSGPEAVCRFLMKAYRLQWLILTCGTRGSYVFTEEDCSFAPTPRVEVRDTVGAGDSFTAAFCAALLKGKPVRDAHRLAVETSAFVCSCDGAMPVLPDDLKF